MKNKIILIAVLCLPIFFSFTKLDEQKFIGYWKVVNEGRTVNHISVTKEGETYLLTYNSGEWGQGGHQKQQTLAFKYENGSLIGVNGFGRVEFINSTGHLKWNEDEWEKSPGNTK